MTRLLVKVLAFVALGAVILNAISTVLFRYESIVTGLRSASDARHVYAATFRSQRASTSAIVLVGDSVASQIVREAGSAASGVECLTSYYTISMVGQYLSSRTLFVTTRPFGKVRLLTYPGRFRMTSIAPSSTPISCGR